MSGRTCILESARGNAEPCAERECPFWEQGGAVLDPGCFLERVLPGPDWTPELAERWVSLRVHISDLPLGRIRL